MPQRSDPITAPYFLGIHTAGNPLRRAPWSAELCQNIRPMPGGWMRLREGRKARVSTETGQILKIHPWKNRDYPGDIGHLLHVNYAAVPKWKFLTLDTYIINPLQDVTISTAYDSAYCLTHPAPACSFPGGVVYYNGLGVQNATNSRPPFSFNGRYFGLDAYCPSTSPTASYSAGTGKNHVLQSVTIWVGLYNDEMAHYSNAVEAGTIEATEVGVDGTISVTNLNKLSIAYESAAELADLKYVFYATIDGYNNAVPYLILNSTLTGPHTVAVTETSASLSITTDTNVGWVLDLTREAPTTNYPPRPMRHIWYHGGRLYGILMPGGSGSGTYFSYVPTSRELAGVVYSANYSDAIESSFVGNPIECWPLSNLAPTPNGEIPRMGWGSDDIDRNLVLTAHGTFLIQEQPDGIHEWYAVDRYVGIGDPQSFVGDTPHGSIWVDQNRRIVRLRFNAMAIEVLNANAPSVVTGAVKAADYILDPEHEIDRYQIWMDDGTSVVCDFALGNENYPCEIYTYTGPNFTAAASSADITGTMHHMVANVGIYTHCVQPEGDVLTTDETFTTGQSRSSAEISGIWRENWADLSDPNLRKHFLEFDVVGDCDDSEALDGQSPISVSWYGDLDEISSDNKQFSKRVKTPQDASPYSYRYQFKDSNKKWFKLEIEITGHSSDDESYETYPSPSEEGLSAKNFYGSLMVLQKTVGSPVNRA